MYLFAVQRLQVQSITHKYLIRGHTQNDGDKIHSIIERAVTKRKKNDTISVPAQYVETIRNEKKTGEPLGVTEMSYEDFIDIKFVHDEISPILVKDTDGNVFKIYDVKKLRFEKRCDFFFIKLVMSSWNGVK